MVSVEPRAAEPAFSAESTPMIRRVKPRRTARRRRGAADPDRRALLLRSPRLGRSEETYGALGTAATLLIWLYVISRLLTGAAFLNSTLWLRNNEANVAAASNPDA